MAGLFVGALLGFLLAMAILLIGFCFLAGRTDEAENRLGNRWRQYNADGKTFQRRDAEAQRDNSYRSVVLLLVAFGLLICGSAYAVVMLPPPNGHVQLAWEYPTNELSTNLWFNIYSSTNLATPLSEWECLSNVVGTNLTAALDIKPGQRFFVMTASNFWGESLTSNVASTPFVPRSIDDTLTIRKTP